MQHSKNYMKLPNFHEQLRECSKRRQYFVSAPVCVSLRYFSASDTFLPHDRSHIHENTLESHTRDHSQWHKTFREIYASTNHSCLFHLFIIHAYLLGCSLNTLEAWCAKTAYLYFKRIYFGTHTWSLSNFGNDVELRSFFERKRSLEMS